MFDEKDLEDKINNSNFTNTFKKMFLPKTKEEYIELLRKNEDRMREIKTQVTLDLLVNNLCYLLSKDNHMTYEDVKSVWDKQIDKGIEMCVQTFANMLYEKEEK